MNQLLKEIDKLNETLNQFRPLPIEVVKNLRDHLLVEWTYHSNSIEGNTLTLSETKVVLEDGITVGGKTMREHLEAINHKEAILYLEEWIKRGEDLTENTIKTIHGLILKGIDQMNAGQYRSTKVLISGAEHIPPDPIFIQERMDKLMSWYRGEGQELHALERAAILHAVFVNIHPFIDGNGRTARLLLNLELMKSGYVPIVIRKEQRLAYYQALDLAATQNDYSDFIQLCGEILLKTLQFHVSFCSA